MVAYLFKALLTLLCIGTYRDLWYLVSFIINILLLKSTSCRVKCTASEILIPVDKRSPNKYLKVIGLRPLTDKNLHQTFEKLRNEFLKIWTSNISNTLFLREFISIIFNSPQLHDSKKKEILRIVCEINVILSKSYYNDILHIEQFLLELYQIITN